jgi:hypothetical protein
MARSPVKHPSVMEGGMVTLTEDEPEDVGPDMGSVSKTQKNSKWKQHLRRKLSWHGHYAELLAVVEGRFLQTPGW